MKKALVTGITGQDGSFLAELLLAKGYEVHGVVRRSSSFNTERLEGIYQDPHVPDYRLRLHYGDLEDGASLANLVRQVRPDEIYNLGAQSHVRVSFDIAEYTVSTIAMGTLRLLEALRELPPTTRFYQASSSEMFGSSAPPQNEHTAFQPRSPYACAKVFAHQLCQNYRDAYGLFIACGILFNHECLSANTPLVVREAGIINVVTPGELVPLRNKGPSTQTFELKDVEIWDGADWTALRCITATHRRTRDEDHRVLSIEARAGVVETTAHHHMLDATDKVLRADALSTTDRLKLAERMPDLNGWTIVTPELAEFLGLLCSEGYVPPTGTIQFTNNDEAMRDRVAFLWRSLFLGTTRTSFCPSGFDPSRLVGQLYLNGGKQLVGWLRSQLYADNGSKRVPALILNARPEARRAFLDGYYAGDGLKAGNGESIKTNSALLAQGLLCLYASLGRQCSVYVEHRGERDYFQLNIASANPIGDKGAHLRKDPAEIRRIVPVEAPSEWVFDVETGTGVVCAGVGRVVVHNSPRRGIPFVTRKITRAAARIKHGLDKKLYLGNLDAKRDWGYAGDYVEAMWMMLQADKPDDYVIATGESHSVRDVLDVSFSTLGLDWSQYVELDPRYLRPTEVDHLCGDAAKAREKLGWRPKVTFHELITNMVTADEADVREALSGRAPRT
jgi:GDPmannose 4,6-dehydratase